MKKKERRFYNYNKAKYIVFFGREPKWISDSEGNVVGRIVEQEINLYKVIIYNEVFLLNVFFRKGYCFIYKLLDSDIGLLEPDVYKLPEAPSLEYYKFWEELEDSID